VNVRRADEADASEIARLSSEFGYPNGAEDISSRLRHLLDHPDHFIAVAPGEPPHLLGWIAAERRTLLESGERVELVGLVVSADARRAGIGRALVSAAERWAGSGGTRMVVVRSNVTRPESHPFYEGIGYVRNKTQHSYVKHLAP
jgi:GNAT superfamily N-acetyltransferase